MARLAHTGYGQIEINNCAFRRDGRIEAQLPLHADEFADGAENGMIVYIDAADGYLTLDADKGIPGVIYSAEKVYEDDKTALKYFVNELDGFLPRVGMLAIGDKFTTNTIDGEFAVGTACGVTNGVITVSASSDVQLKVIAVTTMPDGQKAAKLQVTAC